MIKQHNIVKVDSVEKNLVENVHISGKTPHKNLMGEVIITNEATGEIVETNNLVLHAGREYMTQQLATLGEPSPVLGGHDGVDISTTLDLTQYKIAYFGIGSGGTALDDPISKSGPYDNDVGLYKAIQINESSIEDEDLGYPYLHDGYFKSLNMGGQASIIRETHKIAKADSDTFIERQAYTTLKYTMFIKPNEIPDGSRPARFNEAALYAVKWDYTNNRPFGSSVAERKNPPYITFSRITTMDKWLELGDSIKIEWFILL